MLYKVFVYLLMTTAIIKITTTISPLKEACKVPQTHWYNTDHSHSWGTIQWRDLELETTGKKESCCEQHNY